MPKRRATKNATPSSDPNVAAFDVVRRLTERSDVVGHIQAEPKSNPPVPENGKNPAAVALGRLGGLKGGRARADKLTPKERSDIARKASAKRWKKNGDR